MNIIHIAIASSYTDGMSYQENLLSDQNLKDGHNVTIITNCSKFENGKLINTEPEDLILKCGIRLIRVAYDRIINSFVSSKIRKVKKLYSLLEELKPDVILFHGPGYELVSVAKYRKVNPSIKFYISSHEDYNNSATNFLSKYILHKVFYKFFIKKALPYIDKVFCIAYECFPFLRELYQIPDSVMEFYPLGGIVFSENIRQEKRDKIRKELMLNDNNILIVHSGKMDKLKRTKDILCAFKQVPSNILKLVLIGSVDEEVKQNVESLIASDKRIDFLGWKNGDELMDYLCGCDLYIQPGSQSATMQNALCCGSAAALYPHQSHKFLLGDSVFYIESIEDMIMLFRNILENRETLENKRIQANIIAHEKLDYRVLASRLY